MAMDIIPFNGQCTSSLEEIYERLSEIFCAVPVSSNVYHLYEHLYEELS